MNGSWWSSVDTCFVTTVILIGVYGVFRLAMLEEPETRWRSICSLLRSI